MGGSKTRNSFSCNQSDSRIEPKQFSVNYFLLLLISTKWSNLYNAARRWTGTKTEKKTHTSTQKATSFVNMSRKEDNRRYKYEQDCFGKNIATIKASFRWQSIGDLLCSSHSLLPWHLGLSKQFFFLYIICQVAHYLGSCKNVHLYIKISFSPSVIRGFLKIGSFIMWAIRVGMLDRCICS